MKKAAALAFLFLAVGCTSSSQDAGSTVGGQGSVERSPAGDEAATPASLRQVIRTADITLVVDDAAKALQRIVDLVEARGGYISDQRQWIEANQIRATATLRIPAAKLFDTLPEIRAGATRVEDEAVTGQDVTEEFTDLTSRLKNLESTETQMRALLATVRARSQRAADILEVYDKLTKIREEIELIRGRMQVIRQLTAMSTINLTLIPDALSRPIIEPGFSPISIAKTAARTLVVAGQGIMAALIFLVILLLPLALLLGIIVRVARSIMASVRRGRTTEVETPTGGDHHDRDA